MSDEGQTVRSVGFEVGAILDHEARMMGRECHLIDSAALAEGVVVVVYRTTATVYGDKTVTEVRVVTYSGDQPKSSSIVRSEWSDER